MTAAIKNVREPGPQKTVLVVDLPVVERSKNLYTKGFIQLEFKR